LNIIPRIQVVLAVSPDFSILTQWNTGETRLIPLKGKLEALAQPAGSVFKVLLNYTQFQLVKTDGFTLYWEDLTTIRETDGSLTKAPLDLDPDVLYALSTLA
jgi:Protein of unknown function (DUF2442)